MNEFCSIGPFPFARNDSFIGWGPPFRGSRPMKEREAFLSGNAVLWSKHFQLRRGMGFLPNPELRQPNCQPIFL